MKLSGSAMLHAPAEQIFNSMQDPRFLVRTIPGCQQLEVVGPDEYEMTINAGVASIKGTYLGNVRMVDPVPPQAYTLKASAQSAVGTVDADARISLTDRGGGSTELTYDADARIGGTIAGVGQRVLTGVARKMAGEFFAAVDRELLNGDAGLAASGIAAPAAGTAAGTAGTAGAAAPGLAATGPAGTGSAAAGPAAAGPAGEPKLGEVFRRPAPPPREPAAAWWAALAGAAVGAAIALIGVALGARSARRGSP
jgi:carbon monoxide dehydrogenase subunit G